MAYRVKKHRDIKTGIMVPEYWQPDAVPVEVKCETRKIAEAYEKEHLIKIAKEKIRDLSQ